MYLPTSILKFVQFQKINSDDFKRLFDKFKSQDLVFRTSPVKLSRTLPPMAVKHYMRALTDLNDYEDFLMQKEEEHKMCCVAVLMRHEDYLLKLRIRADMSFVWQVAVAEDDPDLIAYGRLLIQTLMFIFSQEN